MSCETNTVCRVSRILLTAAILCGAFSNVSPADDTRSEFGKTTYTFKTVDGVRIRADVYRHSDNVRRPMIVWFHGGALIMGSRTAVPKQLQELANEKQFVLVSLGYRLAPEAQLPEIIEDLRDGIAWVHEKGPDLFQADTSRFVVAGASAGGYLALMSGISKQHRPTAIVSYWGFGDIEGDWTTKPNEAYRKGNLIDKEVAYSGVGAEVLTSTNQQNGRGRSTFFLYLKQTGRWVKEVTGFDPVADRQKLTPFSPIRNLSSEYPPTMFLHGSKDSDVPVGQSLAMAKALKELGVPHELIVIENGGHGLWGGDRKLIEQAFQQSLDYISRHLQDADVGPVESGSK